VKLTILHTNDVHGRVDGLARVATLVRRIRAETPWPVLYLDAGDVEETTAPISSVTKGVAMHRLLRAAGCDAAAVGNAVWLRYGAHVIESHAAAAGYPILCANLVPIPGAVPSALLQAGDERVGVISVTAPFADLRANFDFGLDALDPLPLVLEHAAALRAEGAGLVVLLSHLGLDTPLDAVDDRRLAPEIAGAVDLVIGAHSHQLLPEGERIAGILVAQAGEYAQHLGRIDVTTDGAIASVLPVFDDVPPDPDVLAELAAVESEAAAYMDEVIGELPEPLGVDAATRWLAEILRRRMDAEVGLASPGASFDGGLPGGPLRRRDLWDVCHSSGNPGVVEVTGAQLALMLARGRDPEFAETTPRPLRGRPRGVLQAVGADDLDPARRYAVAGTDWELDRLGGIADPAWGLSPRYDFPVIVREAIEEHLARR
jgi:2',3'-cyclic-nucleotide 2'-phosphodiesterase (5'-nucleotidase family)